ncbi:ankyrin repeat domain-containing protein [Mitsuaria sp. WAJ17]|uniref:ankyrin repeat domain-containing protein n=1 Tax=Mitsuaria sp. WAJ17 TaxID=2761452 RepID=UPI001601D1F9|nr:ankyrin repeat domain-containing protein [Mitsuaria sp. WAJ17]MBB2486184.1 ankyrin repeat domain-containing protein [Mitsuaria sp. WAJ17]
MSGGDWKELFHAACNGDLELVRYHTIKGVDLNYAHPEFLGTPLVACILAGQEAVALYLLEHGADPHLLSEFDGATPLQAARRAGLATVAQRLLAMGVQEAPPLPPAREGFGRWLLRRAGLAA